VLTVKQQKTGVPLEIPVHPELRAALDATPSEHLTFLVTTTGKPYGPNHFSESFREWCDAAGLPKACSAHGLRKAKCRRLAEAGASDNRVGFETAVLGYLGGGGYRDRLHADSHHLNGKETRPRHEFIAPLALPTRWYVG
jgi:integrase